MTIRLDAHKPEFHRGAPPQLPVRCATTANVAIATALNAGDTIDGVTLAAADRVLVKNQTTGSQNGIYIVGATPARSFDMSEGVAAYGAVIYVVAGTANGGKSFVNTNTTVPTIDTTALTFAAFAAGSALTVSDEGTPLATAATILNFVGTGVTATGAAGTKTITIPGIVGGGAAPDFVGAKVYNNAAAQTIPDGVATLLLWDSEEIDSDGFHSTSSNTGRLTIPTAFDGVYLIAASAEISSDPSGERIVEILRNGTTVVAYRSAPADASGECIIEAAVIVELAAADYVTVQVTQTSGHSLSVGVAVASSAFSIAQLATGGVAGIAVQDEGSPLATSATTLNFVGAGVVASGAGATKTITVADPAGITVSDEGTPLATAATSLDFVGAGVVASGSGTTKTITVADPAGITVNDEGSPLTGAGTTLDFTGAGVTASGSGATKTINIPGGSGSALTVQDEGTPLATAADTLNFVGTGVTASGAGATKTVTIPAFPSGWDVVAIAYVIDGGGATITTGIKGDLSIPFACTITGWRLLADQSGAVVVDAWNDTYAAYPPTVADAIWSGSKPTIAASGVKAEATGLSIAVAAGSTLRFNVDSVSAIQRVTLTITAART